MRSVDHRFGLLLLLTFLLAACAPQARGPATGIASNPDVDATQRTANAAWHHMELAMLETGAYTTNALVDLQLPPGVRWSLVDFVGDNYTLHFTSTRLPGWVWVVTPAGVSVRQP